MLSSQAGTSFSQHNEQKTDNFSRPLTGNKISKKFSSNGVGIVRPKTGVIQLKWDMWKE